MSTSRQLHQHTPVLSVVDARGATVRSVGYYRAREGMSAETRVTEHRFDVHGRDVSARDPRAWSNGAGPGRTCAFSLSGSAVLTDSNDAGWRLALFSEAGPAIQAWDSRESVFYTEYDQQLRPIVLREQAFGTPVRVIERLEYAGGNLPARNQCGRLLRHDDPAGSVLFDDYALGGHLLVQRRRFLADPDVPHWPEALPARDMLLEPGEGYLSEVRFNPAGDPVLRIDALGNRQWLVLDQAGALRRSTVQLAGSEQGQAVREAIRYDAMGRVVSETAGNGVVTERDFCQRDGRLQRQLVRLPGQAALQDLRYQYDPAGNILVIDDLSQPTTFHRNQRVAAQQVMVYDTLYQLIEARGVEVDQPSHGPGLPPPLDLPLDPTRLVNYVQRFDYDAAGNLLQRQHSGAEGLRMAVASTSNRALPQRPDGSLPDDAQIAAAHDGCGNLLKLEGMPGLYWNPRNQLAEVQSVLRDPGHGDYERYAYSADGNRVRKVSVAQAGSRSLHREVRYLPGLELHWDITGESRAIVLVDEHLRIADGQWHYSLGDHLGSIAIELDGQGALLSREAFYSFGGTAVWAARGAVQRVPKTHRYCGKERDASGLYCFGLRYYAPWLARWTSTDPLGEVDGLNLYRMVLNNPLSLMDVTGGKTIPTQAHFFWAGKAMPAEFMQNILLFQHQNPEWQVNLWTPSYQHWMPGLMELEDSGSALNSLLTSLNAAQIVHRDPEEMFSLLDFRHPDAHVIRSIYAREGAGVYPNYAAMSDVFRLGVIWLYGGLWQDSDVVPGGSVNLSGAHGDFYAYTDEESFGNGVLAGVPGSVTGKRLLDELVYSYSTQHAAQYVARHPTQFEGQGQAPLLSWVNKRVTSGDEAGSRLKMTMDMSGPDMIARVLGADRISRDEGALSSGGMFNRRVSRPAQRPHYRTPDEMLYWNVASGMDDAAGWSWVRPGRRASIG